MHVWGAHSCGWKAHGLTMARIFENPDEIRLLEGTDISEALESDSDEDEDNILGQWGGSYRDREPLNSVIGKHGPPQANAFRLQSTASTSKLPKLPLLGVLEGIQATILAIIGLS